MNQLESDPLITKFTGYRVPQTLAQTEARLTSTIEKATSREPLGIWVAELENSNEFVGWFMLIRTEFEFPELGFMIMKKYWGQGYATEIAKALIEHGFQNLGLKQIVALTDPDNHASIQVLRKAGFQFSRKINKLDKVLQQNLEFFIFERNADQKTKA